MTPIPPIPGKMIPLNHGLFALVDESDYESVSAHKWYASFEKKSGKYYAKKALLKPDGRVTTVSMVAFLLGPAYGKHRDHQNGNTLDNRRDNLRVSTPSQNQMNRGATKRNGTGYKGVSFDKASGKYKATIQKEHKVYHRGLYDTAELAALAYNKAAIELHGDYAFLNEVSQ